MTQKSERAGGGAQTQQQHQQQQRGGSMATGGSGAQLGQIKYLAQAAALQHEARQSAQRLLNETRRLFRKSGVFWGVTRTFIPAGGGTAQTVQATQPAQRVPDQLMALGHQFAQLLDTTAMTCWTGAGTFVDIVVDGTPLLRGVPYSYLPYLETCLQEFSSVLGHLPVIDEKEPLIYDAQLRAYRTEPITTPAQPKGLGGKAGAGTDASASIGAGGSWKTLRISGALKREQATQLQQSCQRVLAAVIAARGEAGVKPIVEQHPSVPLLGAIFGAVPDLGWQPPIGAGQATPMGTPSGAHTAQPSRP